jgi:hypothetical protein
LGVGSVALLAVRAGANADGAFSFLSVGEGARPAGMGEAFTAMPDDVNALYWNPAGLSDVYSYDLTSSYLQHIANISVGYVGGAMPAKYVLPSLEGGLGFGVMYVDYGEIKEFSFEDPYGTQGSYRPYDLVVTAGYGQKIDETLSVGWSMKLAHEDINGYTARAIALDGGVICRMPVDDLAAGFTLQNLGFQTKAFVNEYHGLPLTYKAGVVYSGFYAGALKLAADLYHIGSNTGGMNCGAEYLYKHKVFFRLGYQTKGRDMGTGSGLDIFSGITTGLGFRYDCVNIDYAFVPRNSLGQTHKLSLSVRFDKPLPAPLKKRPVQKPGEPRDDRWDNPYLLQ